MSRAANRRAVMRLVLLPVVLLAVALLGGLRVRGRTAFVFLPPPLVALCSPLSCWRSSPAGASCRRGLGVGRAAARERLQRADALALFAATAQAINSVLPEHRPLSAWCSPVPGQAALFASGSRNDPGRNRCGCFLPDLTRLATAPSARLPRRIWWKDAIRQASAAPVVAPPGIRTVSVSRSSVSTDLAGEPRGARDLAARSSRSSSSSLAGGRRLEILVGDDDVAGRAGHRAFAGAFERLAVGLGDVEQPLAGWRLDFMVERSVGLEKTAPGSRGKHLLRPGRVVDPAAGRMASSSSLV